VVSKPADFSLCYQLISNRLNLRIAHQGESGLQCKSKGEKNMRARMNSQIEGRVISRIEDDPINPEMHEILTVTDSLGNEYAFLISKEAREQLGLEVNQEYKPVMSALPQIDRSGLGDAPAELR
jgi:hypothetical protein